MLEILESIAMKGGFECASSARVGVGSDDELEDCFSILMQLTLVGDELGDIAAPVGGDMGGDGSVKRGFVDEARFVEGTARDGAVVKHVPA